MTFLAPWFLLTAIALAPLYRLLSRSEREARQAVAQLRGVSAAGEHVRRRTALKIAGLAMLIVALARPAWNPHPVPYGRKGRDLVIALDISRSMLAADVHPSRIEAARFVLLESLAGFRGQRLGLITFAGSASVRVPLTLDHNFMRYVLERIQPADADVGSTSLQAAVEKALDIVLDKAERGRQDLIIVTDGEDHISDVDRVAQQLRDWGARVLIIGIGDPAAGARVPDIGGEGRWMQYRGGEVISRLDETTLLRLADASPGILYYPARTRPFDLMAVYRALLKETAALVPDAETRVVYDEGYLWFLALGIFLLALSFKMRLRPALALLTLLGCAPDAEQVSSEYRRHMAEGVTAWSDAQLTVEHNPLFALEALTGVRESFLLAAMHRPGDLPAARHIAGVSAQMRDVERRVRELRRDEEDLRRMLEEAVAKLRQLAAREDTLSRTARQLLQTRPAPPLEERSALAAAAVGEQAQITGGTGEVLAVMQGLQERIRTMLRDAFGAEKEAATEYDEAVRLLNDALVSQIEVSAELAAQPPNWIRAGGSLVAALRAMRQALELMAGTGDDDSSSRDADPSESEERDFDETMEMEDSREPSSLTMPIRSQSFNSALDSRSLPVPNYTAEEILAEEAANMRSRQRQNEARAAAGVEKNW
jgi:Ca-activated chloride channel homolog